MKGFASAFAGGAPRELKRLNLGARLALARALELITPDISNAIAAIAADRRRGDRSIFDNGNQVGYLYTGASALG